MKISGHKEATNEIEKKFVCANCGKSKSDEGRIYAPFIPVLMVFFAYPCSKVCNECATQFNAIGGVLLAILLPILVALLIWFINQ